MIPSALCVFLLHIHSINAALLQCQCLDQLNFSILYAVVILASAFRLGNTEVASCLIYAQLLLEYVIFILCVRSFSKMLPSVKFAEDKVLI